MTERFDDVMSEFLAFVDQQVGMYIDALAGFAGHHTQVELQVHRVNRPIEKRIEDGMQVVVWASYEDPTKPDIIHNRIIRAGDYLRANAPGGSNEQQHARAVLIFLFTFWEDQYRPRLASAKNVELNRVKSDVMGDLRIIRHAILHAKGIVRSEEHRRIRKLGHLVPVNMPIDLPSEVMREIFMLIKQDCARLMFDWLGIKDAPVRPEELVGFAIQRRR